jgi:prepilin-type processing-associated H-X9-DG protein
MTRTRSVVVVGVAIALLSVLWCGPFAGAQPLADRVPQDALVYVGWGGSEAAAAAGYDGSHLKGVVEASKLRELVGESIPRMFERVTKGDEDAAAVTKLIMAVAGPMWRHPSALYVGPGTMADEVNSLPRVALICDAKADAKALADELRKVVAKIEDSPVPIKVDEAGGVVVLTFGAADVSAARKPELPLARSKAFADAMARVGTDPVAAVYVDVEAVVAMADRAVANLAPPEAKQKWPVIRDAIGLASLKRVAWAGGFDGKDWSSRSFVESPEPRAGLVKALIESRPLSEEALRAVPRTATMAAAGHFDAGGTLGAVRAMIKKIDADASAEFEQGLDQVKGALGLDLQTDILDTLGDEWAMYTDPTVGGSGALGITMVNRLRDAGKAQKALGQLEQLLNGIMKEGTAGEKITIAFNTTRQGDLTIHYLAIPVIAPAWAIKDGNLYVALYPQVVAGAAEHVAGKGRSILENEAFQALRKRLGGQAVTAVSFYDLPKTAADGYQDVLMLSRAYFGAIDLYGARTPALVMPPLAKLMPHVTPAAGVGWVDKAGWHWRSVAPFPGSELLAGGGLGSVIAAQQAAMVGVALPSLTRARVTANRVKSASNLRQIGQAMLLYANENKGKYPRTMGELLLTQDVTVEVFVNPDTKTRAPRDKTPEELAAWINKESDYEYLGAGKDNTTPAEVVVAHEKFRPNVPGINMLYGDGHVEWNLNATAQQQLIRQKQAEQKKQDDAKKGAP